MFENPRRGSQARNFTTNVPKILDLKSTSEQIFSDILENWRRVPLFKREAVQVLGAENLAVSRSLLRALPAVQTWTANCKLDRKTKTLVT